MKSICGADCERCGYGKENGCQGCGCPLGKPCFIAQYIKIGGMEQYNHFKEQLITEFNGLSIDGLSPITELYPLNGAFVNLSYPLPNGQNQKLLDDYAIYLGTQVECAYHDGSTIKCFGLVANTDFLLVCEYGANCTNPQLLLFKKR